MRPHSTDLANLSNFPAAGLPSSNGDKQYRLGTHRCVDPRETLERVQPHLSKMGITRIANVTGLDRIGIHVALSCRPNSRSLSVSQGKGATLDAAKASAVMESIELYHAERIRAPLRLSSYEELRETALVVDVATLPHAKNGLFHKHRRLLWIEGFDVLQKQQIWVPYEMVSTDFTLPFPEGYGCFPPNSNGLASGNNLLEAVSHGICEVIERDAITLWSLHAAPCRDKTELDLSTITDDLCCELLQSMAAAGITARVWDITSDVGLPSFRCVIDESKQDALHFGYSGRGFGCHPSRAIALSRALTEAAQARLTYIAGSRDDVPRSGYDRMRRPIAPAPAVNEVSGLKRSYSAVPNFDCETVADDIQRELHSLRSREISQVIVIDLTCEDFQIPVAKVIIPALEGVIFEDDYAPGQRAKQVMEASTQ